MPRYKVRAPHPMAAPWTYETDETAEELKTRFKKETGWDYTVVGPEPESARLIIRFTPDNRTARISGIWMPDCVAPTTCYTQRGGTSYGPYRSSGYPTTEVEVPPHVAAMLEWTETSDGSVGGRTVAVSRLVSRVSQALPGFTVNHE